jgi:hypothetical protein
MRVMASGLREARKQELQGAARVQNFGGDLRGVGVGRVVHFFERIGGFFFFEEGEFFEVVRALSTVAWVAADRVMPRVVAVVRALLRESGPISRPVSTAAAISRMVISARFWATF